MTPTATYIGGLPVVEAVLASGRTLSFFRDEPKEVLPEEADALLDHPHFVIQHPLPTAPETPADEAESKEQRP